MTYVLRFFWGNVLNFQCAATGKEKKNMILKIMSSPFAAGLLNLADFLASLLLAYHYRRYKHWGHWFTEDCFLQTERSPMQLVNSGLYLILIDFPDVTCIRWRLVMKVVQVIWELQTTSNIIFSVEIRWQKTVWIFLFIYLFFLIIFLFIVSF